MGTLRVMDGTGDTKIIWDPANPDEVAAARDTFNKLTKGAKRYNAYAVKKGGDRGEIVREFDPDLEKLILAAPMAGG